jgi:hypothetical protein
MSGNFSDRIDLQIVINGSPIQGLLQGSIVTTNCFSSDSYALTFAMGPLPLQDITFWSSLSSAYVEISFTAAREPTLYSLISGMIDVVHLNPVQGIVTVEGRDLSSRLIDSYRQQDFVNQTASEVASAVASYHGLTPVVTTTSGNVGRYYGDGYTRLSIGQFSRLRSDWDLLVQLARENSFDVFVAGTGLFFQPISSGNIPVHLSLRHVKSIRFERTLTIASNAIARVQSWNSQTMASYAGSSSIAGSAAALQAPDAANNQPFLFSASNLTSQQVTDSAGRYADELSRLGIILHIEMPWDISLHPRTIILVDETGSSFDTTYKIDYIERHYSTILGSSQIIRAVVN